MNQSTVVSVLSAFVACYARPGLLPCRRSWGFWHGAVRPGHFSNALTIERVARAWSFSTHRDEAWSGGVNACSRRPCRDLDVACG